MIELKSKGIDLRFDPALGQIVSFSVQDGGVVSSPLHKAPWVGSTEPFPDGMPPHLKTLGGDFFCAPFGKETNDVPLHGWPPNSEWHIEEKSEHSLRARLFREVSGATLYKKITVYPNHPFVYQAHKFRGGEGALPVANHANVSLPNGGIISTSSKASWQTPQSPLETDPDRGRSGLRYPAQASDPTAFPSIQGTVNLLRYPWSTRHEDFVAGIENPDNALGWTAVTRPAEGDLFLSLRDARVLPMTMLWHSNGGRDYPPWSGRHFGCLGVEEGLAASVFWPDQSDAPIASDLILFGERETQVKHVIGAISWPERQAIERVEIIDDTLRVEGVGGAVRSVPIMPDGVFA